MGAIHELIHEDDFDHLIRGGTLQVPLGNNRFLQLALEDIGYIRMNELIEAADQDGESCLNEVRDLSIP